MKILNWVDWVAIVLVIIGGLNWGLVGFFGYNLVEVLFGVASSATSIVYGLVGLGAIYMIYTATKISKV